MKTETASWRALLPALLLAVLGVGAISFASVWPHRAASANQPLVVFTWDRDAVAVVVDAGGRIVSPGRLPGSIVTIAEDPEILARLYQSGALLVLRGDGAIGCKTQG